MLSEWKKIDIIAAELQDHLGPAPETATILGSGLGGVADGMNNRKTLEFSELSDYPSSTVAGHAGRVHCGEFEGVRTLILQGRVHLYEGYKPAEVVRPIRAAITWGVETIILTNAAGGIDTRFDPGQLMLIEDHLNLTGLSPLLGPNDETRGPRFPDITNLYDAVLRTKILETAQNLDIALSRGVYGGMLGPTYETPAEVRMLSVLGAQAVGMSTVNEAIAAHHLGAKVAGISCITNRAAGLPGAMLDHDDVQRAGAAAAGDLTQLIKGIIGTMGTTK
jgi:purine-nucleoside phosphorylase